MSKQKMSVSSFFIEDSFDHWFSDMRSKRSGAFSDKAKQEGRAELRNYDNVYEYMLYRDFNCPPLSL